MCTHIYIITLAHTHTQARTHTSYDAQLGIHQYRWWNLKYLNLQFFATYIRVCMCVLIVPNYTNIYSYLHTFRRIYLYIYMIIYTYMCIYIHVYIYICTHTRTHTHKQARTCHLVQNLALTNTVGGI